MTICDLQPIRGHATRVQRLGRAGRLAGFAAGTTGIARGHGASCTGLAARYGDGCKSDGTRVGIDSRSRDGRDWASSTPNDTSEHRGNIDKSHPTPRLTLRSVRSPQSRRARRVQASSSLSPSAWACLYSAGRAYNDSHPALRRPLSSRPPEQPLKAGKDAEIDDRYESNTTTSNCAYPRARKSRACAHVLRGTCAEFGEGTKQSPPPVKNGAVRHGMG